MTFVCDVIIKVRLKVSFLHLDWIRWLALLTDISWKGLCGMNKA